MFEPDVCFFLIAHAVVLVLARTVQQGLGLVLGLGLKQRSSGEISRDFGVCCNPSSHNPILYFNMAASIVKSLCFLQLTKLPCFRGVCSRFVNLFNIDKLQVKRYIVNSYSHMNKVPHLTQDGQLSHIPVDKLKITYSRSSGPGGQHVNKVSTKAEVRFHVQTAQWIPEEVRREILLKNATCVNKAGELIVTSEISRSQQRNLEDCLQKISEIITEASQRPPEPSAEDITLRAHRLEKRNLMRLKQKRINASTKQARRVEFD
ncbi:large ribosomal subunit protein mL62 [Misgurnus anguillicaudatus]|uniref:large ribosomal subunit protein mL62 n=1 Tax=Misgurnus anguillicaudatus TaxID=75329 RepID=UPI003CCF7F9C